MMIITPQPCLVRSKGHEDLVQECIDPGFILHEKAHQYYWEGQSPLSIKTFFSGRAFYTIGKGYYAVDDTSYLIVNGGQSYTITIEDVAAVESFCLFFEHRFVEEVYHSLVTPTCHLLDSPEGRGVASPNFFERTYQHDALLSPLLFSLRTAVDTNVYECMWLSEQFHELLQRLFRMHRNVYQEVELLPTLRATTREELYRRLYRAKEYASALFDTPITLNEMAHVASLSPNHFLRMFKQLFHQTPHQYLISKRLERAQYFLVSTNRPITEICFALGFESLSSFSWLFRQRLGCSPTEYRTKKGDF